MPGGDSPVEIEGSRTVAFGGERRTFDEPVESVERTGGTVVVQTRYGLHWFEPDGTVRGRSDLDVRVRSDRYEVADGKTLLVVQPAVEGNTALYGFDETGSLLWERRTDETWTVPPGPEDEAFCISTKLHRNTWATVAVDIETGEFVRAVRGPEDTVEQFLDT